MNAKNEMICIWSAIAFMVLAMIGLYPLAGFLPPISPNLSAEEVAAIYQANTLSIRLGILVLMTSAGFMCPFVAAIAMNMIRIEGRVGPLTVAQISAGAICALVIVSGSVFLAAAAFRPERDPALIMMFNDLGWIFILMTFAPFVMQYFSVGLCILSDKASDPVFPRWVGYFNFWVGTLAMPGGLLIFFKTGPFAWDGLFAWWVPLGAFFSWYIVMFVTMRRAAKTHA